MTSHFYASLDSSIASTALLWGKKSQYSICTTWDISALYIQKDSLINLKDREQKPGRINIWLPKRIFIGCHYQSWKVITLILSDTNRNTSLSRKCIICSLCYVCTCKCAAGTQTLFNLVMPLVQPFFPAAHMTGPLWGWILCVACHQCFVEFSNEKSSNALSALLPP